MDFSDADITIIGKTPLFAALPEASVRLAVKDAAQTRFCAGEVIFHEGVSIGGLWILLEGRARVQKSASGAKVLMSVLEPGATLGASCLFVEGARTVTEVEAVIACRAAFLSEKLLRALMAEDFTLAESYMRYLTGRIRFLAGRIESIGSHGAAGKLSNHLLSIAEGGTVTLNMGYSALADALCMSRASLYRALDELEAEGIIRRAGRTIFLKNTTEEI